ncbi:MAG: ABC transporter substrate-binding protein [Candidatus Nealsonbacteria bacterium]
MKLGSVFSFLKKSSHDKERKWPSKKQWVHLFSVLSKRERISFFVFLTMFLVSAVFLTSNFYFKNTDVKPAVGGKYIEGVLDSPRFINPIYSSGSDVDRDLVEIIFSSLVPDLAEEVKITEDGELYEVRLKRNVLWHDKEKLTADDVIFTVKTIQNPDYKSPLRANYIGVEVEKIDDYTVRFKLNTPYSAFMERLDLKIIPEHIWQEISPQNFLLTNYNLKPIGSGPYQFKDLKQDILNAIVSLDLVRFKDYFEKDKPYFSEISFLFFKTEEDLVNAARKGDVHGFSVSSPEYFKFFENNSFNEFDLALPRYFAVFFNPNKSKFLNDKDIREALNLATNKQDIIKNVLLDRASQVDSPVLPDIYGFSEPEQIYEFDLTQAEALLEESGLEKKDGKWVEVTKEALIEFKSDLEVGSRGSEVTALQTCLAKDASIYPQGQVSGYYGNQTKAAVAKFQEKYSEDILKPWGFTKGTGVVSKTTRAKLNEVCSTPGKETQLKFSLITVQDPLLEKVAEKIKEQWASTGIEIEVQSYPISQLTQEIIKPRNYEMLLFGEVLGATPDPFPFWHSSQIKDPGLNLALYENNKADALLESARINLNESERAEAYNKFQNILISDVPAIFLYRSSYIYFVSKDVKGIESSLIPDPSKRFDKITDWYLKQKRAW